MSTPPYTIVASSLPPAAEAQKAQNPARVKIVGASVAETQLIRQLLECGHAERMIFLTPQARLRPEQQEALAALPHRERITLLPYDRLEELKTLRRVVVFAADSLITQAAHLRAAHGHGSWVVSGVTHSLSSVIVVFHTVLLHLQWMQPFDSFICTSAAGRRAVENLFAATSAYLSARFEQEVRLPVQLPVIPLPVPVPTMAPVPASVGREALHVSSEQCVFLYFGRFSDTTKTDLNPLLVAFSQLSRRVPDAVLVLAGDDTARHAGTLNALAASLGIAERVRVWTDLSEQQKWMLYSAADVFMAFSDNVQETFGLTVVEAMRAGLPVIASNWNGYRDLVQHGTTGYLIPSYWSDCVSNVDTAAWLAAPLSFRGDFEAQWALAQTVALDIPATVDAMERLASNPGERQAMGTKGKALVQARFSGAAVIGQYEELWLASLERSRSVTTTHPLIDGLTASDYFRVFGHFASRIVTDQTAFQISEMGRKLLAGQLEIAALDRDRSGFQRSRLIELLGRVSECTGPTAVTALGGDDAAQDLRHLLRLAKYGLLEIVPCP